MADSVRVLLTREQLAARVRALGAAITADYQGRRPILVCVLKGSAIFMSDLARAIDLPCSLEFLRVSSYLAESQTSGRVDILMDLDCDISGRDVIIIEDILDTGLTLDCLRTRLLARNPASLAICTLLEKPARRRVDVPVDYVGFQIDDVFVVGYGLDHAEQYRNLPYVGQL